MDIVETVQIESSEKIGKITYDEFADSPREWDNLGTMICEHKKYTLGDDNSLDFSECENWDDVEKEIKKEYGRDCIMLPLYLYDHSGITMNTSGFSCGWDSGRVGTIVVDRATVRKEFNTKRVTAKLKNQILNHLKSEVEVYDKYISGNVYSYSIEDVFGNVFDSCSGYYGLDETIQTVKNVLNEF